LTVDERIDYLERRLAKYWREALQVAECEPRGRLFRTIMLLERERERRTALAAKSGTTGTPRAPSQRSGTAPDGVDLRADRALPADRALAGGELA